MRVMEKTVEIRQLHIVEKAIEIQEIQMVRDTQTSESLGTAPVRQVEQAEIVAAVEVGVPLPAESASPMFVKAPVLEAPPVVAGHVQPTPVEIQRLVPTIQTAQKTVEVPQVQFLDRVVDVPVVMQRQKIPSMAQERIQERTVGKIIEVTVSRVMEKIIEGVKPIPQECVQDYTVEQYQFLRSQRKPHR